MGRKSTIDGLPDAIRTQLDKLLLNESVTIAGATAYVNGWLKEHAALTDRGEEPVAVSKSAVGRYKLSLEEITADIVETDRLAELMLKEMNISNQSNVAQAIAEMLRVMLMRFIPRLRQAMQAEELSVKDMKDITGMLSSMTTSHERLENSATINQKRQLERDREIERKTREAAAKNVEQAATAKGLDAGFALFLRQSVLQGGV